MATRIVSNWSDIEREIERISSIAIMEAHAGLDAVLAQGETLVRGAVHVDTSTLKGSVKSSSNVRGLANWHGEIVVGGASPGPLAPVKYAWYEYRRGGDHAYFYPLPMLHEKYIDAILNGLKK